ncbi:MAG: hypothetical protein K6E29_08350 [Cyanobacteria bacterium RUI128]|nr:hypothetical protein [Cyanobacteria bacterium RUI128]
MNRMWPQLKQQLGKLAGVSSAKMGDILILTSIAGWFASSAAQIIGIAINKEYTHEQKKFMIAQEASDAVTNILLYFGVTKSLTALSEHMVKTGKLAPRSIVDFLRKNKLINQRGNFGFDVTKAAGFEEAGLRGAYNGFKCFTDAASATIGGIISSNIITPIVRNKIASYKQNKYKERMRQLNLEAKPASRGKSVYTPVTGTQRHTFDDYRNRVLSI